MAKWCCRAIRAHPSKLSSRRRPGSKFLRMSVVSKNGRTNGQMVLSCEPSPSLKTVIPAQAGIQVSSHRVIVTPREPKEGDPCSPAFGFPPLLTSEGSCGTRRTKFSVQLRCKRSVLLKQSSPTAPSLALLLGGSQRGRLAHWLSPLKNRQRATRRNKQTPHTAIAPADVIRVFQQPKNC